MALYGVAVVTVIVGVCLAWRGWRGGRIDDHPICRKCGYDLSGIPTIPLACSECGSLLTGRTRIGNRRRRPWHVIVGVMIALASGAYLGVMFETSRRDFDWNTIKPVWWLRRNALAPSWPKSAAAINELLRRARAGSLDESDIDALIEMALAVHGDPAARWIAEWGEVMRYAHDESGRLTPEQWHRFLHNLPGFTLQVTSPVRSGGLLEFEINRAPRVWKDPNWPGREFIPMLTVESVMIDGETVVLADFVDGQWKRRANTGFPWSSFVAPITASPGTHKVAVLVHGSVSIGTSRSATLSPIPPPVLRWSEELTGQVVVVPSDQPLLVLNKDSGLQESVRKAIEVESLHKAPYRDHHVARLVLNIEGAPANLFHKIFARIGEREWHISSIQCQKGDSRIGRRTTASLLDEFPIDIESVDLVFRPDLERAETLFEPGAEFFAGEIVLPDVPIHWERGSDE